MSINTQMIHGVDYDYDDNDLMDVCLNPFSYIITAIHMHISQSNSVYTMLNSAS